MPDLWTPDCRTGNWKIPMAVCAELRVRQWRQPEFKVGGDETPKWVGCGEGVLPSAREHPQPGKESGRGQFFCFVISKWRILLNSEVLNLKFFFIVSFLSEVWVDSLTNFGFSCKTMNKKTPLSALIGQRRLILVCYIRTYQYVALNGATYWWGYSHWRPPQPKYWRGCVPGIPGGVDASAL